MQIQTPDSNLSKDMRHLNGVYTDTQVNRRHLRVGHVVQARFKSVLVDRDAYLLELSRYVVLNPIRFGMVNKPAAWTWSNARRRYYWPELDVDLTEEIISHPERFPLIAR